MTPSTFKKIVIGAFVLIMGALGFQEYRGTQMFGNFNPTGGGTYLLQSSISASQSTITLTSFTEPGSGIPYTMSYINTDIIYGTISPSSNNSEFVSASGIVQNANGTATLTGVIRGLARTPGTGGCVASSTLAHAYPGQTQFILSNSPCFYSEYIPKRTGATSTAVLVFSSTTPPRYDSVAAQGGGTFIATTSELASVAYVNAIALSSAPNASVGVKGVVDIATALQAASSSQAGVASSIRVIPAGVGTDTPQSGCAVGYTAIAGAGCSVFAQLTGKIRQAWINLTEAFTWTGLHTFSAGFLSTASSTMNATTSIAASNVLNKAFILNAIPYAFPATQGASSTVWANNGSGVLTNQIMQGYASGQVSTTTGIGDMVILHDLGVAPKLIKITTFYINNSANVSSPSIGTATSTTAQQSITFVPNTGGGNPCSRTSTTVIIDVGTCVSASYAADGTASVTAITPTSFSLTWTVNQNQIKRIIWEAYR